MIPVIAIVSIGIFACLVARATWIRAKTARLSSPPALSFKDVNFHLPPKGEKCRIVLIGDSRISRWPTITATSDHIEFINRGIGAETAAQLVMRFQADCIALDPDIVIIESGLNDLVAATFMGEAAFRTIIGQTTTNLTRLAQTASASGARVFLATIIPAARPDLARLLVWRETLRTAVAEVNDQLRRAALPEKTSLLDFSAALGCDDDRTLPDKYRRDTSHLNEAGYGRITRVLLENLSRIRGPAQ